MRVCDGGIKIVVPPGLLKPMVDQHIVASCAKREPGAVLTGQACVRKWVIDDRLRRVRNATAAGLQGDTFSISAVFLSIKVPYFSNSCTKTRK